MLVTHEIQEEFNLNVRYKLLSLNQYQFFSSRLFYLVFVKRFSLFIPISPIHPCLGTCKLGFNYIGNYQFKAPFFPFPTSPQSAMIRVTDGYGRVGARWWVEVRLGNWV